VIDPICVVFTYNTAQAAAGNDHAYAGSRAISRALIPRDEPARAPHARAPGHCRRERDNTFPDENALLPPERHVFRAFVIQQQALGSADYVNTAVLPEVSKEDLQPQDAGQHLLGRGRRTRRANTRVHGPEWV
jgi:hypothetical protein